MQIKKQLIIDAPVNRVWDVLGTQFASVADWVSFIDRSAARTDGRFVDAAPCSGRVCHTTLGPVKEQITVFDERRRILAYDAVGEKMPFFVRGMSNHWTLTPIGPAQTRVDMRMRADLMAPFSVVMGPLMKLQMGGMLKKATEELKFFVETGKPHPRKVHAQEKGGRQAA